MPIVLVVPKTTLTRFDDSLEESQDSAYSCTEHIYHNQKIRRKTSKGKRYMGQSVGEIR